MLFLATVYEIKFSTSFSNVRGDGFLTNSNIVTPSMILHGSLSPLAAGSQQRVTVRFPSTTHSYFVSITTFDDSRNSPPESNVVQVLTLQTCQYQGQTFQDPDDCSIYYVCENPGFPATQMSCPSNLCYNSDLSACDWPS